MAHDLLASARRGRTVEVRAETLLRGWLQQAHMAHRAGAKEFAEWEQAQTPLIPQYCAAVAGAAPAAAEARSAG